MALLGNIKTGTLPNLLRALSMRRATATLICERFGDRAVVHMKDGRLRRVMLGGVSGEDALAELFRWKEGIYSLIKGRIEENVVSIAQPTSAPDNRKHVLVVDDDAQTTALIERYLERDGFRVSIAFEGKHALNLIAGVRPDLVLLDVMMPGMNGLEVARRLREQPETEKLPIIIVSAVVNELPDAYRQWNWPFLAKPFKAQRLIEMIRIELARGPSTPPEFAVPKFELDADVSAEIVSFLAADMMLLPAANVYAKSEALEIRLALGTFNEETVRFFDLFDGIRALGEIVAENQAAADKINFLALYMATFGLLERIEKPIQPATGHTTRLMLSHIEAGLESMRLTGTYQAVFDATTDDEDADATPKPPAVLSQAEAERLRGDLQTRHGLACVCAKLIVFGLVGRVQAMFTTTLRTLARSFEERLSGPVDIFLPAVPGIEIGRISLSADFGLLVYQLAVDAELPKLVRQIGSDLWGVVYLTDVHNRFEINYTKYLLQSVGDSYELPFLVAAYDGKDRGLDLKAMADELGVPPERIVAVDPASPDSVVEMLRRLIEQ